MANVRALLFAIRIEKILCYINFLERGKLEEYLFAEKTNI
jgi:hypothetical protein